MREEFFPNLYHGIKIFSYPKIKFFKREISHRFKVSLRVQKPEGIRGAKIPFLFKI
jgi:hypothetical protein